MIQNDLFQVQICVQRFPHDSNGLSNHKLRHNSDKKLFIKPDNGFLVNLCQLFGEKIFFGGHPFLEEFTEELS